MMLRKAVVIGGSIAGILTARILSNHFDEVIIVEKDRFEDNSKVRNGTPQASHIHLLLVKGRQIIEHYFPDLEKDILKKGANKIDFLNDAAYLLPSGWAQQFKSGISTFTLTRTLFEETLRSHLKKFSNIKIQEDTLVTSFEVEKPNKISLKTNKNEKIQADLIVDCSGRNTKTPNWLEDIGYPKPVEEKVDSFVGYATRRYIPPKNFKKNWKMLAILNKPTSNPRSGIIYPIENGMWLVGLSGIGKNYPPVDETGFLEFAKNLESRDLYDSIKEATPDSDIVGYRIQGSRKYDYEEMSSWPQNFLVLGDAGIVFNPFYGQGITSSALGIQVLEDMLKTNDLDNGFALKFQKRLAKAVYLPWILGTSEDHRWPTTLGKKPTFFTKLMQTHAQKVLLLGPSSKLATKSFLQMMHMIKSPLIIFHPVILFQLVLNVRKQHK